MQDIFVGVKTGLRPIGWGYFFVFTDRDDIILRLMLENLVGRQA